MNIKEIKSEILGESYYEINHPTGLKIFVMPKENYSSAYAIFGTKYGSIDTRFKRSDSETFTEVPEGIAHFLEHKLFESEELDAFELFQKTGASANAYTSFEKVICVYGFSHFGTDDAMVVCFPMLLSITLLQKDHFIKCICN